MPAPGPVRIDIRLGPRRVAVGVAALAAVSIFFVATTYSYMHAVQSGSLPSDSGAGQLWRHFNLSYENVMATWYSSMLIFACAVMAWLCFVADTSEHGPADHRSGRDRWLSRGWILTALLFALLSLDELGSLHERIGGAPWLNLRSGVEVGWVYILALPIMLVGIALLVFAWLHLRRHRWVCALFVAATAIYLVVPALEHGENLVHEAAGWADDVQREAADYAREEGVELLGALCFFGATALYASSAAMRARHGKDAAITLQVRPLAHPALAVALIVAGDAAMRASELAVTWLPPIDSGIPNNWFPSALAALAAFVAFTIWDDAKRRRGAALYIVTSVYALILSAYYGAHWRGWLNALRDSGNDAGDVVDAALLATAVVLALALARRATGLAAKRIVPAFPALLALALSGWQHRGDAGWVDYWACAALLITMLAHRIEQGTPADTTVGSGVMDPSTRSVASFER